MGFVGQLILVALGAAAGGALRFFVSGLLGRRIGEAFPWGTMVVNVTGCFAVGGAAAFAPSAAAPTNDAWLFAVTGLLGAYTTVSSFSLQTLALARDGEHRQAAGNVAASVGLSLAAAALGYWLATMAVR
jgi:CrcB protein